MVNEGIVLGHKISERGIEMDQAKVALLQDAANATLRSETLRRNYVRCHNHKWWCKNPSKRCKTFAMEDASNTVQILVACAMQGIQFSSINCLR